MTKRFDRTAIDRAIESGFLTGTTCNCVCCQPRKALPLTLAVVDACHYEYPGDGKPVEFYSCALCSLDTWLPGEPPVHDPDCPVRACQEAGLTKERA